MDCKTLVVFLAFAIAASLASLMPTADYEQSDMSKDKMMFMVFNEFDRMMNPGRCEHKRAQTIQEDFQKFKMCMKGDNYGMDEMDSTTWDKDTMKEGFKNVMEAVEEYGAEMEKWGGFPDTAAMFLMAAVGKMTHPVDFSHAKDPVTTHRFTFYEFILLTRELIDSLHMPKDEAEKVRQEVFTNWAMFYETAKNMTRLEAYFQFKATEQGFARIEPDLYFNTFKAITDTLHHGLVTVFGYKPKED